jgi:hypothetical protein
MRRLLALSLLLAACNPRSGEVQHRALTQADPAVGDVCTALMSEEALSDPPALPLSGDPGVRMLAFGDFGEQPNRNTAPQRQLAEAMVAYHADHPFDFGVTLGDNFYPRGLSSPTHPRWESQWERLYSPMGIRVYAVFGNHDYNDPASPAAEIERSRRSATWCLPRHHYTFLAGPVQLFALDTVALEEPQRDPGGAIAAQRQWLDRALAASRARWKVVYSHHPIYSNGHHADSSGTLPRVRDHLLPLLRKHRVDVYLAGHEHDLEVLEPEDGIHFFVSGAAGRHLRRLDTSRCRVWGTGQAYGFTVLEADPTGLSLKVSFVGSGREKPYRLLWGPAEVRKGATSECRRKI